MSAMRARRVAVRIVVRADAERSERGVRRFVEAIRVIRLVGGVGGARTIRHTLRQRNIGPTIL